MEQLSNDLAVAIEFMKSTVGRENPRLERITKEGEAGFVFYRDLDSPSDSKMVSFGRVCVVSDDAYDAKRAEMSDDEPVAVMTADQFRQETNK
jgi:hypothetical protein